jgi:hypothetical protein
MVRSAMVSGIGLTIPARGLYNGFMNAILIAGAALVGLPIVLHLIMKQEPKRLTFPAFRFLTQQLRTNQRKLRLRHFLLLLMRMLLIALFCLTLYQPTVLSERLNLSGEQPVAAVIVLDTSPSMGYVVNEKSRLDEARKRALELLDELPSKSMVAIVDTAELNGHWADVTEARKQLEKFDKPRAGNQPVTAGIAEAYRLLSIVDQETESSEPWPRLVAVITDRAAACWDSARTEDLKKLLERVPLPKPAHALFDVGVDHPTNVAILGAEMQPQVISANQVGMVTVTVAATGPADGPPVEVVVRAKIDDSASVDRKGVSLPNGQTRALIFEFKDLKPGLHQVEFGLETPDKLMFDNSRYLTFKVGEARRILTITDDVHGAAFWQLAHQSKKEFGSLVVTPDRLVVADGGQIKVEFAPDPKKPDETISENIREFEAVCLLSVADPSKKGAVGNESLWDKLRPYVEAGGKLVIIPGANLSPEGYAAGGRLMPGTFKSVLDTSGMQPPPPKQTAPAWDHPRDGQYGVTWYLDDSVLQHPMLRPFQGWRMKGNVDAVKNPARAKKYWDVAKAEGATVVVYYNDSEKPNERHPAVLEANVPDPKDPKKIKSKVVLLTTRLDIQPPHDEWNDYWEVDSSWTVVLPWLLIRYLAGDTADANFNYLAGQAVTIPLPKEGVPKGTKVAIEKPQEIVGNDALIEVGDKQTELRVGPPRTNLAGNFLFTVVSKNWREAFSLNVPAEESTLDKVPVEAIEELTGKNTVVPVDRNRSLREIMEIVIGSPVDLFPWLLILVLVLLSLEGLVANRFYRRVKP